MTQNPTARSEGTVNHTQWKRGRRLLMFLKAPLFCTVFVGVYMTACLAAGDASRLRAITHSTLTCIFWV